MFKIQPWIIYILVQQKGKIQIKNKGICCFVVIRVMSYGAGHDILV